MPFDPTRPVPQTEIDADELHDQFNSLKALNDAKATNVSNVQPLNLTLSDPPVTAELQIIIYKMNELIAQLQA